jgi:Zn-dependent peptidase ImmA (M78 family)/transcriptional regulator with XRE-family HTH domain
MADKMTAVNPKLLIWAREASGTTLAEAEKKFGKDRLAKWETGSDFPTYPQLKAIGEFYRKPIAVFFFPQPPALKSLPSSCRTLPEDIYTQFNRGKVRLMDKARAMQINLYELNASKNPAVNILTKIAFDSTDIFDIAFQLRKLFGADLDFQKSIRKKEDAFEYWRECFYNLGVYVFKDAFKDDSISGFCIYDFEFPLIYINNSLAASRQIFTLFHEAYHIINKTSGVDLFNDTELLHYNFTSKDTEIACNLFAGAFLVPNDDFLKITRHISPTDKNVAKLASLYCVSSEVILRKFLDNKRITPEQYEEKREEFTQEYLRFEKVKNGKDNGGGDYYNTQASYKGKQYMELAFKKYYTKQIDIVHLAKYMDMKIPSVKGLASRKGWGAL